MSEDERRTGKQAALRRFPAERQAIEQLMSRDVEFCDMCAELAEAERALLAAELLPSDVRDARTAEWGASIDRLVRDMARTMREANVVRIGWAGGWKSHR